MRAPTETVNFAGPTSMIYSGHATIRHTSHLQHPPPVARQILEAVKSGIADSIFVYRHPLDSLLTNWILVADLYSRHHRDQGYFRGLPIEALDSETKRRIENIGYK
jgi:hypothetical protein